MKKNRLQRSDIAWSLSLIVIIALQFWWLPGEKGTNSDSYSHTIDGKLGLYRTLSQLFPQVIRDAVRLHPETSATLIMVAPDRYPSEPEQQELSAFIQSGGCLLFAPHRQRPEVSIPSLGIECSVRTEVNDDESGDQTVLPAESPQGTSPLVWKSQSQLVLPARFTDRQIIVSAANSSEKAEVAMWRVGSGTVMVSSSPEIFSNRSLLYPEPRRLAVRLVEKIHQQHTEIADSDIPVVVSEYLNASDSYRQTGVLLSPALRSGSLQLILLAVLAMWYGFHRFGPAIKSSGLHRRTLTDSARAVGSLQYRLQDGGAVVKNYLDYIRGQPGRRSGNTLRLEQPEVLAARTGMDAAEVARELQNAAALARTSAVSSSQAAASVRWLASLQNRLSGLKGTSEKRPNN